MLRIISLWVIQRVFDSSKIKLGAKSQMFYINCLMHHFKDLEPLEENSMAFELSKQALKYDKFQISINELSEAGLIEIRKNSVLFYNLWGKYIEKSNFTPKVDLLQKITTKNVIDFEEDLNNSTRLKEHCMKVYKINQVEYERLLKFFIEEQTALESQYQDMKHISSHFYNWVSKHHSKQIETKKISSSNNILGM